MYTFLYNGWELGINWEWLFPTVPIFLLFFLAGLHRHKGRARARARVKARAGAGTKDSHRGRARGRRDCCFDGFRVKVWVRVWVRDRLLICMVHNRVQKLLIIAPSIHNLHNSIMFLLFQGRREFRLGCGGLRL
jgi:hypothetical protein